MDEYMRWAKWRMAHVLWWEKWSYPNHGGFLTSFDSTSLVQDLNAWREWRANADQVSHWLFV